MIESLSIKSFRGIQDVRLDPLRRVNLIVGGNDSGKTSILEALTLLLGDREEVLELPVTFRDQMSVDRPQGNTDEFENFWLWLFKDRDRLKAFSISASEGSGSKVSLVQLESSEPTRLRLYRNEVGRGQHPLIDFESNAVKVFGVGKIRNLNLSIMPTGSVAPYVVAERYNQIALAAGGEARLESLMRQVNPDVKRLRYAKLPNTKSPLIFVDLGLSRAIPAPQMGQAFNRLLHIYTEILSTNTDILLVDEIENGIFTSNLVPIWKGLLAICEEEDVQIFATTHSLECVRAALAASDERSKDELCVQRMQIVDGRIEAVALSQETLAYALENDLEIRK
jgi:energy-coupling factor transporter ATP-binding protein EcfA2